MSAVITPYLVCNRCEDFNVGYVQDTIDQYDANASMITPQFMGVSSDGKIELSSITCPNTAYGKIFLQILNGDGSTKTQYNWKRKKIDGVWNYGWMLNGGANDFVTGVTFEPGDAFWVWNYGAEGVNTFNTSGQVNQKDVEYPLAYDSDAVACGNCFPQQVNLQDILCPNAAYGKIFLQILNGDGSTKTQYNWKRKKIDGVWNYGWMLNGGANDFVTGVTFKAGQGFWVWNYGTEEQAYTITFPGVELN